MEEEGGCEGERGRRNVRVKAGRKNEEDMRERRKRKGWREREEKGLEMEVEK